MKIRQHTRFPEKNWCRFCGGRCDDHGNFSDELRCVERDDGINALAPEPKRREYACEDAETISMFLRLNRGRPVVADQSDAGALC